MPTERLLLYIHITLESQPEGLQCKVRAEQAFINELVQK